MQLLKIVLTSALIAGAAGAGVFGIIAASLRISDLLESSRKYKKWYDEQTEFEQW